MSVKRGSTLHSYSISPFQNPFWNKSLAASRKRYTASAHCLLPRTNRNDCAHRDPVPTFVPSTLYSGTSTVPNSGVDSWKKGVFTLVTSDARTVLGYCARAPSVKATLRWIHTWFLGTGAQAQYSLGTNVNTPFLKYPRYNQLQKCWDTPTKKRPFLLQIAPGHRSVRYKTDLPLPSHSKLFLQVLRMVLWASLIRGGGGITSTRSCRGHLWQNTVHCLKYFCNWL